MCLGIPGKITEIIDADTLTARVVGVSDGDTITVLDASKTQYKIRLAAIDAPERPRRAMTLRAAPWMVSRR